MLARPVAVGLALVVLAVSGCIGDAEEEVKVPTPDVDPVVDENNTTTLGPLDVPTWSVGQWWAHHTYFGPDDKAGNHFNVVVVEAGSGYTVASQSADHARIEAETDLFDLGTFSSDLSTTYKGNAWSWYEWPLEENKTWTQSLDIAGEMVELEFRTAYADDLKTAQGPKEGFRINGTTADGTLVMTYDYVVEMGWFAELEIYDPADPSVRLFKIMNMGFGEGKTGDYVQVELVDVVNETYNADAGPATATLTVPEGATQLVGSVSVSVDPGAAMLTLTDPEGAAHEYTVMPPGGTTAEEIDLRDPPAGDWSLSFVAVGTGSEAMLTLTAVMETVGTL